uniref:AAA+ ATPase domain-containing protein n=1 Tax=Ditylum brightwellii TaxID=49249 RepID=A0A7S4RHH9_9STRA
MYLGKGRCRIIEAEPNTAHEDEETVTLHGGDAVGIVLFTDRQNDVKQKGNMTICSVLSKGGGAVGKGASLLYDDSCCASITLHDHLTEEDEVVCSIVGVEGSGALLLGEISDTETIGVVMILCPNGMVTPLISLSLIGPMKSTALNVSSTQMQLQHRCVKRQIAGLLIHSVPHSDVTQIKTSLGRYTVQDTSPSSEDSFIALITPSTNITISLPSQPSSDNPSATHTKQKISPVATEILHTLQLLRLLSPLSIHLPRAFLLTGPPGVGKTHAVRTAMNLSPHTTLQSIRASELLSSHTNPAIALTKLFSAPSSKSHCHLCCVFIDECDALLSHPAIPPALATLLDNLPPNFIVIAATNRIDAFPSFLTRPGRLDCHIALAPPTATQRFDILTSLLQQSQCTLQDEHVIELAHTCVGYVPADLMSLVRRAAFLASSSSSNLSTPSLEDNTPIITLDLLQNALNDVGASALRDAALSAPPKTSWDDIAGDAGGAKVCICGTLHANLTQLLIIFCAYHLHSFSLPSIRVEIH